ncbi:MAG TPA: hypothetical protein VFE98_03580 [Candidatus Bathyarchaeia archaeon]|nr:hypothetical protein [Candidatus Bathyarchaeia archaeon]
MKLKRVVQIGRCKNCNDSYKIITVYVKAGARTKKLGGPAVTGEARPNAETTLPSWQVPSDTSLFGASSSSKDDYSLTRTDQRNRSRSTGG